MFSSLENTLRDALAKRGLMVEAIDHALINQTIDALKPPAQRWVIRLSFGLSGLSPKTLEEISELVGDKNPNSVKKILKDGMNSLSFKIAMAIRAGEKPAPEPDPEDGLVRLDGTVATEKEVEHLNTPCDAFHLSRPSKKALAGAGIKFIGDLIQRTVAEIKSIKKLGRKGLICVEEDLRQEGLSLGSRVTGWQRPTTPE